METKTLRRVSPKRGKELWIVLFWNHQNQRWMKCWSPTVEGRQKKTTILLSVFVKKKIIRSAVSVFLGKIYINIWVVLFNVGMKSWSVGLCDGDGKRGGRETQQVAPLWCRPIRAAVLLQTFMSTIREFKLLVRFWGFNVTWKQGFWWFQWFCLSLIWL